MSIRDCSDFNADAPRRTHPHQHARTFLYSESGAAAILRADEYADFAAELDANLDSVESVIAATNSLTATIRTAALSINGDRDTGLPDVQPYAITPSHAGTYNETYDRLWCTLYGPAHPYSRHARRDRAN